MTKVFYATIDEYPGYDIGTDGSVWSYWKVGRKPEIIKTKKQRAVRRDRKGYPQVTLRIGPCQTKSPRIHTLVLTAFISPKPLGMEACHRNGNREDVRLGNLRWGTHQSNNLDKKKHGTSSEGERNSQAKLTEDTVREMRFLRESKGLTFKQIADVFNVCAQTAHQICVGKSWEHIK